MENEKIDDKREEIAEKVAERALGSGKCLLFARNGKPAITTGERAARLVKHSAIIAVYDWRVEFTWVLDDLIFAEERGMISWG